ncbi:MAG: DUF2059 domain-containing protein [Gemmatimonadota bacterium]|nr:MAG: DUF2059 domain-containing protein [Gemmatimonadota bacterium]
MTVSARPRVARRSGLLVSAILLAIGLVNGTAAWAQQAAAVEPEKAAAIRQLLTLTQASELMVTSIETSLPAQKAANPEIPEEFWDEFERRLQVDLGRFIELLIPLYDKYLTLDEIRQLIEFYQSPLGQRLVEVQPQLAAESMLAGQQWGAQLGSEVAADLAKQGIVIR